MSTTESNCACVKCECDQTASSSNDCKCGQCTCEKKQEEVKHTCTCGEACSCEKENCKC